MWEALYRLLEDPDLKVRKAAYHTLTDGGNLDDSGLDPIFKRVLTNETDYKLRRRVEKLLNDRENEATERADFSQQVELTVGRYPDRGKCDFYGTEGPVKKDFDTNIPDSGGSRIALICEECD